jgi:hypothetical protein
LQGFWGKRISQLLLPRIFRNRDFNLSFELAELRGPYLSTLERAPAVEVLELHVYCATLILPLRQLRPDRELHLDLYAVSTRCLDLVLKMFGSSLNQNKPPAGGLFGSSQNTNTQPTSQTLFGGTNQQPNQPQQSGGLFSGLGQNTQNQQQQQSGGLFGGLGQSTQQTTAPGGLFGGLSTQQNQQQSGGLFSSLGQNNQQNQQQAGGLFGPFSQNNQQNQQQGGRLFDGFAQNNQQQQNQRSFMQSTQQQSLPQLGQSTGLWQANGGYNPRRFCLSRRIHS